MGIQQAWVSRIELGHGQAVPLGLWIALGVALGRPLAVSLTRPLGETRQPGDAGHLAMQEHLIGLARKTGRSATFELPTRPADPSRSIDVCVRDGRHRILIVAEAWNTFGDVGAAIRTTHRKQAEAADLAATIDDGPPFRVATVWVVRASETNRALLRRYPEILRSAFPGSSRRWVEAMTSGAAPPREPDSSGSVRGRVGFMPGAGGLTEPAPPAAGAARRPHPPPRSRGPGWPPRPPRPGGPR